MAKKLTTSDLPEVVQEYLYFSGSLEQIGFELRAIEGIKHNTAMALRKMGIIEGVNNIVEVAEQVFDFGWDDKIADLKEWQEETYQRVERVREQAFEAMKKHKEDNS